jgi:FG-GAP-like repeat
LIPSVAYKGMAIEARAHCSAYVYSAPTVVDLNHDGKLETIIGTSVGYVYVLDHTGAPLPGWPVQMGEVQAQVAVADVDGDGFLEMVAVDTRGNVAMLALNGTVLWDTNVRSPLAQPPSFGDIDGDGRLEVVFGSAAGEVHALDARTGAPCWRAIRGRQ